MSVESASEGTCRCCLGVALLSTLRAAGLPNAGPAKPQSYSRHVPSSWLARARIWLAMSAPLLAAFPRWRAFLHAPPALRAMPCSLRGAIPPVGPPTTLPRADVPGLVALTLPPWLWVADAGLRLVSRALRGLPRTRDGAAELGRRVWVLRPGALTWAPVASASRPGIAPRSVRPRRDAAEGVARADCGRRRTGDSCSFPR